MLSVPTTSVIVGNTHPINVSGVQSIVQNVIASAYNNYTGDGILAAGQTWTGWSESSLGVAGIQINLSTDRNCHVYVEQSMSGDYWDITDEYEFFRQKGGDSWTAQATASYFRTKVKNADTGLSTSFLRFQTALCPIVEALPRSLNEYGEVKVDTRTYQEKIAEKIYPAHHRFRSAGFVSGVGNTYVDLWDTPVPLRTYEFPNGPMQMSVVSSNSTDESTTGWGVRTVDVHYLDNNWQEQKEVVALNGISWVDTVATNIFRINYFHAASVGPSGFAFGDIKIADKATQTINYSHIRAGNNSSNQNIFTIPAYDASGNAMEAGYISSWTISANRNLSGPNSYNSVTTFRLNATSNDGYFNSGVFQLQDIATLAGTNMVVNYSAPIRMEKKTDIKVRVISDQPNTIVTSKFNGWYE